MVYDVLGQSIGAAGGDLGGLYPNPLVTGLDGYTLSISNPQTGQAVIYNGSEFANATITLSGDVTGAANANTVSAISGSSPIVITPSTLQFTKNTTSPTLTQATVTSDVATQNISITSQAPFASASTNKSAGNIILTVPASISGTSTGYAEVVYGSTVMAYLGAYQGNTTISALYMNLAIPSSTNYSLAATSTVTTLNAPSTINLQIAGTTQAVVNTTGLQVSPGGTNTIYLQELVSNPGVGALYLNPVTPSATNYTIRGGTTTTQIAVPSGGLIYFNVGSTNEVTISGSSLSPVANNSYGLGGASNQFGSLYTTGLQATSSVITATVPILLNNGGANPGSHFYSGTGAPGAIGTAGDFYFRVDGSTTTHIYFNAAGTWTGII